VTRRIRVADVIGMPVVGASGHRLGHVVDLEVARDHQVTAILVGRRGWLSRLHLRQLVHGRRGERIPWRRVDRLARRSLHLKEDYHHK
jgi:sporulation protein YlmC with PRC-barrel domain